MNWLWQIYPSSQLLSDRHFAMRAYWESRFTGLWASPYPELQASGTYRLLGITCITLIFSLKSEAKHQNSLRPKHPLPSLLRQETAGGKDALHKTLGSVWSAGLFPFRCSPAPTSGGFQWCQLLCFKFESQEQRVALGCFLSESVLFRIELYMKPRC